MNDFALQDDNCHLSKKSQSPRSKKTSNSTNQYSHESTEPPQYESG